MSDIGPLATPSSPSLTVGVVAGSVGGAALVIACILVSVGCLLCCIHAWRKRQQTLAIQQLPSFRVLDVPNPTYSVPSPNGAFTSSWHGPDRKREAPVEIRSRSLMSTSPNSKDNNSGSATVDYSYATPDEIRISTLTREFTSSGYAYAHSVTDSKSTSPPIPYSVPVTTSTSPLHSPVESGYSAPIVSNGIYMRPATNEQSLYMQIKSLKVPSISRQSIEILDQLGSGQFGNVHRGEWQRADHDRPRLVAIKTLKSNATTIDKVKFLQEAAIMGQFHHPNVVELHGVVTEGTLMIVLELMPKGDLRNYLFSLKTWVSPYGEHILASGVFKEQLTDEQIDVAPSLLLSFCRQIASGMEYLSKKSFVHRDLAARNILMDDERTCKVGDFGMSRDLEDENYYISHGGRIPVKWTSCEALSYRKFSTASDVWSFGVLMYEIWSLGHKPFEGYTNKQTLDKVENGYRLPPPPGCPRAVYQLMIQCWHPECSGRPSFKQLVLSLSDGENREEEADILEWSDEDRAIHQKAATLGADLDTAQCLYMDLQMAYISDKA